MDNLVRVFTESSPPLGFTYATGQVTSSIPTVNDVKTGNYTSNGWSAEGQRRNSYARRNSLSQVNTNATLSRSPTGARLPPLESDITPVEEDAVQQAPVGKGKVTNGTEDAAMVTRPVPTNRKASGNSLDESLPAPPADLPLDPGMPYPNGYQFPPKHSTAQSIRIGLYAFARFVVTPLGFLITLYGLNVVAWGGMLFLVLIGGAPAMCHPSCSDQNSAAKKWLEIDSQILNALFCVTGLGLIPWRFRDLYYLLMYRWGGKEEGIRRLAGLYNDWFRLKDSDQIPVDWNPKDASEVEGVPNLPAGLPESAFALPVKNSPAVPLTGERAPPTKYWKVDLIIWCYVWNTFVQIALCGVMWGLNRFNRPGWTTGLLISLACIVAMVGGYMGFREGKKVKKIEGVPVSEEDLEILRHMRDEEKAEGSSPREGESAREKI